jgi:hypothetical protein
MRTCFCKSIRLSRLERIVRKKFVGNTPPRAKKIICLARTPSKGNKIVRLAAEKRSERGGEFFMLARTGVFGQRTTTDGISGQK